MRNVYPVFFTKTNDNVLVEVPDLDILTEGKDMNDAIDMARDAIELKCVSMEDEKEDIPNPSNVGDLNENNPWFNVDKIYYHNYFEGKDNNKDEYPKINLKDIDRFGIDKNENEQTYAIYATEIDKEDEEVGKKAC